MSAPFDMGNRDALNMFVHLGKGCRVVIVIWTLSIGYLRNVYLSLAGANIYYLNGWFINRVFDCFGHVPTSEKSLLRRNDD